MKIPEYQTSTKTAPIIQVFDAIPGFVPSGTYSMAKEEKLKEHYYFTTYDNSFGGNWMKVTDSGKIYFNFEPAKDINCRCHENLLPSLRGAFIIQMILGVRDRHKGNTMLSKNCIVKNIDYGNIADYVQWSERNKFKGAKGWQFGGKNLWDGWAGQYMSMYNSYLDEFLLNTMVPKKKKVNGKRKTVLVSYRKQFFDDLFYDLKMLKAYIRDQGKVMIGGKERYKALYKGLMDKMQPWNDYTVKIDDQKNGGKALMKPIDYIYNVLFIERPDSLEKWKAHKGTIAGLDKSKSGYDKLINDMQDTSNDEVTLIKLEDQDPNSFAEQLFHDIRAMDRIIVKGGGGSAQSFMSTKKRTADVTYGICTVAGSFEESGAPNGILDEISYEDCTPTTENEPGTKCIAPKECKKNCVFRWGCKTGKCERR